MQSVVSMTKIIFYSVMRNPLLKILSVTVSAIVLCVPDSLARPAMKTIFTLVQPDGTEVAAKLKGDEFMKILTTADGCAIGLGKDGWYYYAGYGSDGMKELTEYRAGHDAPAEILAQSRIIPYNTLRSLAADKRKNAAGDEKENLLVRTKAAGGVMTKSGGNVIEKHGIVILAQFQDIKFKEENTRESFVRMLTEPGYSYNGADGSAIDYFNEQFEGHFSFTFEVSDIVTLSKNCSYYGENNSNGDDKNPVAMVTEACRLVDDKIDFSRFDDDADGEVDNVFIFFAGGDEAEGAGEDRIWSHAWYVKDGANVNLSLDGKIINRYACTSELSRDYEGFRLAGIGTFCHEFSHTLGLQDCYDTDYELSGGTSDALWGSLSLMDNGNSNNMGHTPPNYNAVDRDQTDVFEPVILTAGTHTLEPVGDGGTYYRMDTDTEDEYFLFECRAEKGWDRYIGGSGLLIYHIDKSLNSAGYSELYLKDLTSRQRWLYNEVNCNPEHQCADLIEALPGARNVSQVFFPYRTNSINQDSYTPMTDPAFTFWNGNSSSLALTEIKRDGENIILTVNEFKGGLETPVNVKSEIFQDAAIITWEAPFAYTGKGYLCWEASSGGTPETIETEPYEPGKYSVTLEGLSPKTPYRTEIYFEEDGVQGKAAECNFMTKSGREQNYPFIYLYNVGKNSDGTFPAGSRFPLRLYNATEAEDIVWYMDGEKISVDGSGYYTPKTSGEMKAEVFYEDGSKTVVTKNIVLK